MTLTTPAALWLLLCVPLVWLAHVAARTTFNPRQRVLQAGLRSLLIVALVLAMARPVVSTMSDRQSMVFVVDVSHSVSGAAIQSAAGKIDELKASLRPAHSRIVAFGKTSATLDSTDALRRMAQIESTEPNVQRVDRRGTDLEAALDAARAELAPGHIPRIVLFTDGRATAGDLTAATTRLSEHRVPVFIDPLAVRSLGDTWIDALDLPDRIVAGAPFTATVTVQTQRNVVGDIEVRSGDTVLASRQLALAKGVTQVPMDVTVDAAGASVLQARVVIANDPLPANSTLSQAIWAATRPKVLYVEGRPSSSHYLARALTESGFEVTVRPPAGLPATLSDFDPWDVVILSDVSRTLIRDNSMSALSEWVERHGGGLLVAGGESVFGEGGYRKSQIERLTPVTFERKDEPEVALVLVLDRSWSMAGASMELCKAAAQAAVDVMTDEQSVGILTFNDSFNWDVPLRNVGHNRDSIRKRISAIGPGGHTLIYPAVEQAYLALKPAKARAKHVLLLSDGRSYPADYESLVRQMVDARITVSSVAVGPSADPELLGNIAKWGKGRTYAVSDAKELPQIFVKEAKNAATPAFDEKEIKPIVKAPAFLSGVDLTRVPLLKGRTATVLKDTALEVISTDEEDPLLAFWPVGLGRAAVFASDVKDRWAANWIRWRGYGPFFSSLVRALERRQAPAVALDVVPGPIRGRVRSVAVAVETRDAEGGYKDLLRPAVEVKAGAATSRLQLRQVAPGRYEATVVADADQPLTVTAVGGEGEGASRMVVPDPAAEYRFSAADEGLLKSLAQATGGGWVPTAETLAKAPRDRRTARRPIAPALIVLALALWFSDILLRRMRVFEAPATRATREVAGRRS
ncbi:MAG: VWA domain-containing protein [Vicinamibacterales bacterium]